MTQLDRADISWRGYFQSIPATGSPVIRDENYSAHYSPDLAHDGHNDSLHSTDRYVSRLVPGLLRALGPRGLLYVSWDEGRRPDHRGVRGSEGGGRIALIAAGGQARRHAVSARPANQYALLRSLEAGFGLRTLGQAGAEGTPLLTGLVKPPSASHRRARAV